MVYVHNITTYTRHITENFPRDRAQTVSTTCANKVLHELRVLVVHETIQRDRGDFDLERHYLCTGGASALLPVAMGLHESFVMLYFGRARELQTRTDRTRRTVIHGTAQMRKKLSQLIVHRPGESRDDDSKK